MSSFSYRLQRSPMGVVIVDATRKVVSANGLARHLLERDGATILGHDLLSLHPEPARAKVQWMLDAAKATPHQPAGMSMTLPMGTLIARVSTMDLQDGTGGWCLVFHLPEDFGHPPAPAPADILVKLPVGSGQDVILLDMKDIAFLRAEGHYTRVHGVDGDYFCGLSFGELGARLDPAFFLRVHRSFLINLGRAEAIERADGQWAILMDAPGRPRIPVSRARVELVRKRLGL